MKELMMKMAIQLKENELALKALIDMCDDPKDRDPKVMKSITEVISKTIELNHEVKEDLVIIQIRWPLNGIVKTCDPPPPGKFYIRYDNPDSPANGEVILVMESAYHFPHHYLQADGKYTTGDGRLLKKYCTKI